ncbi:SLC13 family permease [Pyrolobus fumarii]|nr:SLC13 family permease [Pyrolobus fumarii]
MESHVNEGVSRRKIVTFVLLAIIGSAIIAALLPSLHVPETEEFLIIHKVFSKKVCKENIIEIVLEGKVLHEALEKGSIDVSELCKFVSLNDPVVKQKQTIAAVIFYVSILAAITFWERRVAAVFLGFVALILTGVLPFRMALESMELGLILFLISMMIVVGYLKESGFLRFITVKVVALAGGSPTRFLFILMLLSFVLAALVDEVSSIVYVTLLVLETAELLGLNPIPWLIVAVFATNLGSAATMIGNPIGIYIGLFFEKGFTDFLRYASPAAFTALLVAYPISLRYLERRGEIGKMKRALGKRIELDPWAEVKNKTDFYLSAVLFVLTILGIALHTELAVLVQIILTALYGENAKHMMYVTPHDMLVIVPVISAAIVIARTGFSARKLVEERVEWWALLFFMFLFAEAATLSYTGVTDVLAYLILAAVGGEMNVWTGLNANLLVLVVTAVASGFVDNMPIIVALSPVAKTLMSIELPGGEMLPWSLLFGGTMGGNLTIIGSTANIVAIGIAEKRGFRISFQEWIKIGAIVVAATLVVAYIWLALHVIEVIV